MIRVNAILGKTPNSLADEHTLQDSLSSKFCTLSLETDTGMCQIFPRYPAIEQENYEMTQECIPLDFIIESKYEIDRRVMIPTSR